jgi:hypothetical protein
MADPAQQNSVSGRFGVRVLIEEAQREAFIRRRVYPNQVRAGRMSQKDADRRIDRLCLECGGNSLAAISEWFDLHLIRLRGQVSWARWVG